MEKIIKIKEALELARSLIDMAETEEWNEIDNAIKICTDGINKNDLLPDVSQHRELLLGFMQMREGHAVDTVDINLIDTFLEGRSQ